MCACVRVCVRGCGLLSVLLGVMMDKAGWGLCNTMASVACVRVRAGVRVCVCVRVCVFPPAPG